MIMIPVLISFFLGILAIFMLMDTFFKYIQKQEDGIKTIIPFCVGFVIIIGLLLAVLLPPTYIANTIAQPKDEATINKTVMIYVDDEWKIVNSNDLVQYAVDYYYNVPNVTRKNK